MEVELNLEDKCYLENGKIIPCRGNNSVTGESQMAQRTGGARDGPVLHSLNYPETLTK